MATDFPSQARPGIRRGNREQFRRHPGDARGIGGRVVDRIAGGASEVYEEAMEVAVDNKGVLAAIVGALLLWFAREPIREAVVDFADAHN